MVNIKTKFEKRIKDNDRRRQSLKEKEKAKQNQSLIIKQALSNSALNSGSSKKIIFDSDNEGETAEVKNKTGKSALFDDGSGSEDEDLEIKEKSQFVGKKGFELLNLQSTYGNDQRFKIDERFLDKEEEEEEEKEMLDHKSKNGFEENSEKVKQLRILESVLGEPIIKPPEMEKKPKKRTYEMIRYDATNKDHERYEIKVDKSSSKKKKERKKIEKMLEEDPPKVKVSKEKFYEISNDFKNSFKEKKGESSQFSLLQVYGANNKDENGEISEDDVEKIGSETEEEEKGKMVDSLEEAEKEDFTVKSSKKIKEKEFTEEVVNMKKEVNKVAVAKGIWKESFFFAPDDPRLKEGLEFINKKDSKEALEAAENYDTTRRKLKEILRLHMKKQLQKKNPFKKKVGGMNKKQLKNSNFKNFKTVSSRRKPPKVCA